MRWAWMVAAWAAGCAMGCASGAGALPLRGLETADQAAGWEAVGRLDIDGKGFCTGSLIAPDLVLTAAHCLFDRDTGAEVAPGRIEFRAGLRRGQALATRGVRRAMAHPLYVYDPHAGAMGSRDDLALLQLDQPIRSSSVVPFETGALPPGGRVGVVSYAVDRAEVASRQDGCDVLGEEQGVVVMDCDVDFGASGAPVFGSDGRIVSVVSAKGELDGAHVSLGAGLGPLPALRAAFAEGPELPPQVRTLSPSQRAETGAKFIGVGG